MTEACANVVVHAYPASARGKLHLAMAITDGTIVVTVCDDGYGMRRRIDSPGLGAGLRVIHELADAIRIGNRHPGAELHMTFNVPAKT